MSTNTQPITTAFPHGPVEAVSAIVAFEFFRLAEPDRSRLVEFTLAMREISRERGGPVTDRELLKAGFSPAEQLRHMPSAARVLQILAAKSSEPADLDRSAA